MNSENIDNEFKKLSNLITKLNELRSFNYNNVDIQQILIRYSGQANKIFYNIYDYYTDTPTMSGPEKLELARQLLREFNSLHQIIWNKNPNEVDEDLKAFAGLRQGDRNLW